jgi:hypothetical protein
MIPFSEAETGRSRHTPRPQGSSCCMGFSPLVHGKIEEAAVDFLNCRSFLSEHHFHG